MTRSGPSQSQIPIAAVIIGNTLARLAAGRLHSARRVTFDTVVLLAYYAAGQGLLGLLLVHALSSFAAR